MIQTYRAIKQTYLKTTPADSTEILPSAKVLIQQNTLLEGEILRSLKGHHLILLAKPIKQFEAGFIFAKDFQLVRKGREHDFSTTEGTKIAIVWECEQHGLILNNQKAYVLATTEWETARTFRPVKEAYWRTENWRRENLRYFPYYGRGYVQLTWRTNYVKYGQILGIDLVANPDMALNPNVALFILCHGMARGMFTGHRLDRYLNGSKTDYYNARRVVNGLDKAREIEALAQKYWNDVIALNRSAGLT